MLSNFDIYLGKFQSEVTVSIMQVILSVPEIYLIYFLCLEQGNFLMKCIGKKRHQKKYEDFLYIFFIF